MLKEIWLKWKKEIITFVTVSIIFIVYVTSLTDNSKIKQQYNGLVMTDKQGRSYMIRYNFLGMFTINEFDTTKMRLVE